MTPEDQRIAIGSVLGYKNCRIEEEAWADIHNKWHRGPVGSKDGVRTLLPDYPKDLNACHEMEKVLKTRKLNGYIEWLRFIINRDLHPDDEEGWDWFEILHATAAQRCEAFLKTLGLWKETK